MRLNGTITLADRGRRHKVLGMDFDTTHRVGIIPFDIEGDDIALLFVTSQARGRWILPKGKQEPGETPIQTCVREGYEEAGVRGVVIEHYPMTITVTKQVGPVKTRVPVTYYPFLVTEQVDVWPEKHKRLRHWTLFEDAARVAFKEDLLPLLKRFEDLKPWIIEVAAAHKAQPQAAPTPAP